MIYCLAKIQYKKHNRWLETQETREQSVKDGNDSEDDAEEQISKVKEKVKMEDSGHDVKGQDSKVKKDISKIEDSEADANRQSSKG